MTTAATTARINARSMRRIVMGKVESRGADLVRSACGRCFRDCTIARDDCIALDRECRADCRAGAAGWPGRRPSSARAESGRAAVSPHGRAVPHLQLPPHRRIDSVPAVRPDLMEAGAETADA